MFDYSFRVSKFSDYSEQQNERLANSSFKNIAFPLGCSRSEFKISLDNKDISLLNGSNEIVGFIRIKNIMLTHSYLDFFCLNDEKSCSKALNKIQKHIVKNYKVNKFFIQLLEHEKLEQSILEINNYEREASLRKHIWLNGSYKDVYIYGSQFYV